MTRMNPISFFKTNFLAFLTNFFFLTAVSLLLISCIGNEEKIVSKELDEQDKRKVENALLGLEIYDGLEISTFASEPLLVNPTNIDIDHKGRVWVCEAYNYRYNLNPSYPTREEGDRIIILEDTNGDGTSDLRKVFYQGKDIDAALGIAVFGNKTVVSTSPNVWVFTDEDGDDIPDKKELLFTGIGGFQHDHAIHAFVFGPDGKLYFNFGNEGKQILDKNGNPITDKVGNLVNNTGKPYREGMIFRCNTDGSELEVLAHNFRNNFEVAVDAYGALWQSDNDDDGNKGVRINYVMEYGNYGYKDEMTGAGWRTKRTGMHDEIPKRHWHLNDPGVVPNLLQTGAGSPTGIAIYEGRLLPEVFWDQMIHSDAGPNIVRSYPVKKKGAGFKAEIVNLIWGKGDAWFRPSDVCVAPDGSLFIADWYDPGVGGHQMGDQERGRIYRIAPKGHSYEVPKMDISTPRGAVEAMKSPNMATRYIGWTAVKNFGFKAENNLLEVLNSENQRHRARALWLLANIKGKSTKYTALAIGDNIEEIRMCGIRIAQQLDSANLSDYLETLANDKSRQVRREVAIATRFLNSPKAADIWALVASQYTLGDRWYLEALGIGSDPRAEEFFTAYSKKVNGKFNSEESKDIIWRTRAKSCIPLLKKIILEPSQNSNTVLRYFRAFDFHKDPSKEKVLIELLKSSHTEKELITKLALDHIAPSSVNKSSILKEILLSALTKVKGEIHYIDWVQKFDVKGQESEFQQLMLDETNSSIGIAAARWLRKNKGIPYFQKLLNSKNELTVSKTLTAMKSLGDIESWTVIKEIVLNENNSNKIKRKALQVLGTGWQQEVRVMEMLKNGEIPKELENIAANILINANRSEIRKEAATYLKVKEGADLPPVSELVAAKGNEINGKVVFENYCISCHQVNGKGIDFGPNLSEIGNKLSKDGLYASVMYPNAGIGFGYEGFVIETKDGSKLVGYINSKTEDNIELRQIGGITSNISISDVVSIEELENSLMISGLDRAMGKNDLIDLIEYLTLLKKSDK
jgi:putative membrane-bound dehydrogenase-like protein